MKAPSQPLSELTEGGLDPFPGVLTDIGHLSRPGAVGGPILETGSGNNRAGDHASAGLVVATGAG